ncbi:rCG27128 [Rattus norvegicus]|uniref:RCG27128 n=1 Tax=Rattus norvegicus TaxID=10116 RepID=A6HPV0_RAT|nr:rCG27128 [Rattus norvegicus]
MIHCRAPFFLTPFMAQLHLPLLISAWLSVCLRRALSTNSFSNKIFCSQLRVIRLIVSSPHRCTGIYPCAHDHVQRYVHVVQNDRVFTMTQSNENTANSYTHDTVA